MENRFLQMFSLKKDKIDELELRLKKKYGKELFLDEVSDSVWGKNNYIKEFEDMVRQLTIEDSYFQDIDIAIYMILSYYYADKYDLDDDMFMFFEILQEEEVDREKGVRGRWDKNTLKYFPIEVKKKDMTGWCKEYQRELFCFENIDIFDIEKKTKDITRYGFQKSKKIYECLKNTSIENVLLLDFTLGLSLTNCIYNYTREIDDMKVFDRIEMIIGEISQIPCICIRNQIAEIVFSFMHIYGYCENAIDVVENTLRKISSNIIDLYWTLLQIRWCEFVKEKIDKVEFLKKEKIRITNWWKNYYSDDTVYIDVLEYKGVPKLRENGTHLSVIDAFGELQELFRGNIILEKKEGEYENMTIKDISEELRMINSEIFKEKIDIKESKTKIDKIKLYAIIHRKVIKEELICIKNLECKGIENF